MTPERYQQAKAVFAALCNLDAAARAARLAETCASDPELRALVEALLANDDQSLPLPAILPAAAAWDSARQAAGASTANGSARSHSSPSAAASLPARVGPFRIVRQIGEGGMGVVYEAEQDIPRRTVALKLIRPGVTSSPTIRRFRLEANVLGRLQHPGVAQIYEAGTAALETAAGLSIEQPYFAMEYVRGQSLTRFAAQQRLGMRARLELVVKICDAAQHAHQNGVIHRDLKPGNILVDGSGQPKILDFGVARARDADAPLTTIVTHPGQIVGTFGYMSPEQVGGQPGQIDTRTDVYSLGAILFELLAGRPPHELAGKSLPEAARIVAEREPSTLRAAGVDAPGDLQAIVAKALERDRDRRYASAAALADDLRHYLAHEPVTARPATTWYQIRKFARRNRILVSAMAIVACVLVGGVISTSIGLARATRAETSARHEAARSQAISDFVTSMIASVEPGKQGRDVRVLDVLDQAAETLDTRYADQPGLRAALHERIGASYHRLGSFQQAIEHFQATETLLRQTRAADTELASVLSSLGTAYHMAGQHDQAETALREAVNLRRRGGTAQAGELAKTLNNYGGLLHTLGHYDEAGQAWTEALQLAREHLPPTDPQSAAILNNLASLALRREDDAAAGRLYQEALQHYESTLGPEHPDTVTCRQNLASVFTRQGDSAQAESLYRDVLAVRRRRLGPEHAQVAVTLNNLAKLLLARQDYAGAAEMYADALRIMEKSLGPDHPNVAIAHNNLAHTLLLLGQPAEAEPHASRALEICTDKLPAGHRTTALCRAEYGGILLKLGRPAEAGPVLRQAYAELTAAFGPGHPRAAEVAALMAEWADAQGLADEAAEWRARQTAPTP